MKYRLFTNDAGPNGYSALKDIEAKSIESACIKARTHLWRGEKGILLPLQEKPYWPDTGKTPPTANQLLGVPGSCTVPVLQEGTKQ